jgi:Acyl-coenzyme A:6-aminopenicillanic acid acyl-transferase
MLTHHNYFEIEADTHYDLGLRTGELFGNFMRQSLEIAKQDAAWPATLDSARAYVGVTAMVFPQLIEEVHGYAEGARVCFEEAWTLLMEDELSDAPNEKCTTIITNKGSLIAHNEDWEMDEKESICVLRKTIAGLSILELFYMNTLGGNAISINSHGFVQAVNSLVPTDEQIGVPRNVIARWLSQTKNPESDFWTLSRLPRSSGYHHSIVNRTGHIWSIECTAKRQVLTKPRAPFVHTNHFLTELASYEGEDSLRGTQARYRCAWQNVRDWMPVADIEKLAEDTSEGNEQSIFNDRTIGRMVVDFAHMTANIWLRREDEKGWVAYPLDLVSTSRVTRSGATNANKL